MLVDPAFAKNKIKMVQFEKELFSLCKEPREREKEIGREIMGLAFKNTTVRTDNW